jgi:hypothetical protein
VAAGPGRSRQTPHGATRPLTFFGAFGGPITVDRSASLGHEA